MKKLFSLFGLLSLLALVSCTQNRVVEYPDSETVSEYRSVYKIEVSDTATIVSGNTYNYPNYWVKIPLNTTLKGRETGKEYKLVRSCDFELDKEVYMPESGTMTFTLQFEPLDKADKTLDYFEADENVIAGISLIPQKGKYHTHIVGTVTDRPQSSRITLAPYSTDYRVAKWTSIPIIDGKFEYDLYTDEVNVYSIAFWDEISRGSWRSYEFFSEQGEIDLLCYPMDAENNEQYEASAEPPLRKAYTEFLKEKKLKFDYSELQKQEKELHEQGNYYTAEMQKRMKEAEAEKDDEKKNEMYMAISNDLNKEIGYTPEAVAIIKAYTDMSNRGKTYNLDYIKVGEPDMVRYFLLYQLVKAYESPTEPVDKTPYIEVYNSIYAPQFPNHPLTEELQRYVSSKNLQAGGQFLDFTAPDLEGKQITLSEQIKGKVAIIDLWASWCGPCRRHSMELIPIYEEYKDKGFTVVGVARENNDTKAMEKAIKDDGYPWINLVELNDKGLIWQKYGAGNGGGMLIMVDATGKVIAVNPTDGEVREKLKELLG